MADTSSPLSVPAAGQANTLHRLGWMIAALMSHTGWGIYPVLARYLQVVSRLPSMSILVVGSVPLLLVMALSGRRHWQRRYVSSRVLWWLALVVLLRSITNLLAARYTLSVYVQLITQMTPFVVAVLGALLFQEHIPPYTGRAVLLSLVGAVLLVSGRIGDVGAFALSQSDWIGVTFATASTLFLALYMLLVRHTVHFGIPGEVVFMAQLVVVATTSSVLSLFLGEDWSRWTALTPRDWVIFLTFVFGVILGANVLQIGSLRRLGAPLVSSMLAWRWISALVAAALLLGERLTSFGQFVGAAMIFVVITWYVRQNVKRT
ncbi:MAG: EamA family transporter [Ardenticatenia bacterium]|nr:EamA family transporter [Ardenticatenia bacterium]